MYTCAYIGFCRYILCIFSITVGPLSISVCMQIALKLFLTGSSSVVSCNPPAPPAV